MRRGAVLALLLALLGSACGGGGHASGPRRPVTVFAAAPLAGAFRAMEKPFTEHNDGYRLMFSFADSQKLAAQVAQGAPADVIATADRASMARAEPKTLHKAPALFARDRNAHAEYFVMVIPKSKHRDGGDAFRSFVLSSSGRKVLERYGFASP